jgi:hypothetical protein
MKLVFSILGWLHHRLSPPCAVCAAEAFPRRFAELEQALRTAYPAEKGFSVRVSKGKDSWAIYARQGLCSGFAVECAPIAEAKSFSPTRVSVRVCIHSPVFVPAAYLLIALYFSLIALAGVAPLLGWGQLPGPALMALWAALGLIACGCLLGCAQGIYLLATGNYRRLMGQLAEVREVARSVLAADDQAYWSEKVRAQRFRRVLGGFLICFGLIGLGGGCLSLWEWWFWWDNPGRAQLARQRERLEMMERMRTGDLVVGSCLLYLAAVIFVLAYACLRRGATEKPPNPLMVSPVNRRTAEC